MRRIVVDDDTPAAGTVIDVNLFVGECADDEWWIISDGATFYDELLKA